MKKIKIYIHGKSILNTNDKNNDKKIKTNINTILYMLIHNNIKNKIIINI
jgi:hypothetical protein